MRFCRQCKKEKTDVYCDFCKMETNSDYVMKPLTETIKLTLPAIRAVHKRPGIKRFLKEVIAGYKPSVNKEKHPDGVTISRVVDKENNLYEEIVTDNKTGETFRNVKEPLDQHFSIRDKNNKPE